MLNLTAKIRKISGKKVKKLRQQDMLPGVLYGPKIKKAESLEIDYKSFEKVFEAGGESSLISLEIEGKKTPVLIHDFQKDPLTGRISHVDFYQVSLEEKTKVEVPIVLEGISPAVKDLGGTLVKHIAQVEIKALPQNLPKEIKVGVETLRTFDDDIKISDLKVPEGAEILRKPGDIVASVLPPEKVEEELEKPIEEKVEEVEKVGEKEKLAKEEEKEEEEKEEKPQGKEKEQEPKK
jgi:large subunit ribosomal protein L25